MRYAIFFLVAAVSTLTMVASAEAVPELINYQGYLTDDEGNPVADGDYQLTFRIYDQDVGGVPLWTEMHPAVPVSGGLFNVVLGSATPLNVAFDVDYWLGVQIGAEPQLPRIRLTSVGYSYRANQADHAASASNAFHAVYADSAGATGSVIHADTSNYAWNADRVDGLHASEIVFSAAANNGVDWYILTSATWEAIDSVSFDLQVGGNVLLYGSTYFNIHQPESTTVIFVLAVNSPTTYETSTARFFTGRAPEGYLYAMGGYHAQTIVNLPAGTHKVYLVGGLASGTGQSETNYRSVGAVYLGPGIVKESHGRIDGLPLSSSPGGR
jgi:hypothetical protein